MSFRAIVSLNDKKPRHVTRSILQQTKPNDDFFLPISKQHRTGSFILWLASELEHKHRFDNNVLILYLPAAYLSPL